MASDDTSKQSNFIESEDKLLSQCLSNGGKFTFCSLAAMALCQMYPEPCNRLFAENYLKNTFVRMQLNEKNRTSILTVFESDCFGEKMAPYSEALELENQSPGAILKEFLVIALIGGRYDARSRTLLRRLSFELCGREELERQEQNLLLYLKESKPTEEESKETDDRSKSRRRKKFLMVGAAAVGGGLLIGLTGGLAAPFIAAGAGAVIGTTSVAAIGTVAGAAIVGSLFGVAGAGLTGYKMQKRVGSLKEFEFLPLTEGESLHVCIAVSGFIKSDLDFYLPWRCLQESGEQYYLRWESDHVKEMGQSMAYLVSFAKSMAIQETLKLTVLSTLLAAIAWPATLLTAASVIDNPWSVCVNRAEEAGKVMAEALMQRQQGGRPVTLIGFSLGARVIFYCLKELLHRKKDIVDSGERGAEGIIEDVYLLGAPVTNNVKDWNELDRIVSGRIVNGYLKGDWMLRFLFRTATVSYGIAGLGPVLWKNRRMCNIDLGSVINTHEDYLNQTRAVMELVGLPVKPEPRMANSMSLQMHSLSSSSQQPGLAGAESSSIKMSRSDDVLCATTTRTRDADSDRTTDKSPPASCDSNSVLTAHQTVPMGNIETPGGGCPCESEISEASN